MPRRRPNLNKAVRALLEDIRRSMEEFAHIRPSRILVVAGEARRASRGTVKPLALGPPPHGTRRKPTVRVRGRRMLYCITLRPLFFRSSTPQARVGTILHELFHIAPEFDGTLDLAHRHAQMGGGFARALRPIVRRYLNRCPPEVLAPFAYDGEVQVQHWLERPAASYVPGKDKVRRLYTEDHLFLGPVRMITRRARAVRTKTKIKLH